MANRLSTVNELILSAVAALLAFVFFAGAYSLITGRSHSGRPSPILPS